MRIHFIAIGGAVMHNLAITLHKSGHYVTGSDDVIYDPAQSNLDAYGLLPEKIGWDVSRITKDIDIVILGMHAKEHNVELLKALEYNLFIQSFPEFIASHIKDKMRVVIGGSHGKTTTTSMIMHVLHYYKKPMDYLVGAQLPGFDEMVSLSTESEIAVIEGDEYMTSTLDLKPKFLHYKPNIAVITGIAWDHVNVFPDEIDYIYQFQLFSESVEKNGVIFYDETDHRLIDMVERMVLADGVSTFPFKAIKVNVEGEDIYYKTAQQSYTLQIFGEHNYKNAGAALCVCKKLGFNEDEFGQAMESFSGASKRFQRLSVNEGNHRIVFLDFAHSPSKVRASTQAISSHFANKKIIVCLELHTYSSLSKHFLPHYQGALDSVERGLVYYNPHAVEIKQLERISKIDILEAFGRPDLEVSNSTAEVQSFIEKEMDDNTVLVFMSSANFGGIDFKEYAEKLTHPDFRT